MLQAKQLWVHWLAQQTPSTQIPVAHWLPAVQLAPCARLTVHLLASQKNPVWHWPSPVQLAPQLAPMHRLGLHDRVAPATQVPLPLQVLAACSVEPVQPPGAHSVIAG